ncbi:aspartate aminotransferase family protein [Pseudomaricurvus alcaniphilus]|uniref:aspartate aminotransferase family protein n=1 Tax=Pseudomaricurvus alcaniphilus TaxID=1166482 RepID=UPI001409BD81|nr:aspartate aminotransferase family protein [Pseudomaricurvus alcaniphilus]NHN39713.1 aspartate aminotransferase family protein [Pseudomaricurvus alcaniphilus]
MATTALMNTYGARKLTLVRGEGVYVWDDQNRRYLDALAGIAVCGLGHCHSAVTAALQEQANTLVHVSNLYNTLPQQRLADLLCELAGMDNVFFSNSGAEANEAAIKIARKYGNDRGVKTPTIVTMDGSFHGRTMATLTATGNKKVKAGFAPLVEGFLQVPYNNIEAVKALAGNPDIVAVLVEPVQGEGGIRVPDDDYLVQLRQVCDANQWLLMLDEIQSGNGRTGELFAFQHHGVVPDVVTSAKGLGNGLPIGACLARGEAATILQPGNHGSTYGGNPLVCHVASSVLTTLTRDNLIANAHSMGEYMLGSFNSKLAGHKLVAEVRGKGLMLGIELKQDCGQIVDLAIARGLLLNVTAGNTIRLLPPLIINLAEANQIINTVCEIIDEFASQL